MIPLSIEAELAAIWGDASDGSMIGAVASGTYASDIEALFTGAVPDPLDPPRRIHRKRDGARHGAATGAERQRKYTDKRTARAKEEIAVLDMETDPFDRATRDRIFPFCCEIYSDKFAPIVIWEEDERAFADSLIAAIEALPGAFTIYAHNGGKFDFMFLIHRLRGEVSFKGRGIMSAKIGNHQLRDSAHLIPEKLAAFQKEEFDYQKMHKSRRGSHKKQILDYLHSDCVYLFDIVKSFVSQYGLKISIGQASMMLLKREYPSCKSIKENEDEFLRKFFYGGRVECLAGGGEFSGDFKLYDVNSMYPDVMASMQHPISNIYEKRAFGELRWNTCFVDVTCRSNGAFPVRREMQGTTFPVEFGRFFVSAHEFRMAEELGLIDRVTINSVVDNDDMTDFSRFILPLYNGRLVTKQQLKDMKKEGLENSPEYITVKKDDIFLKLFQNNAYGKFAQNPRRFREHWLTDPDAVPGHDETDRLTYGLFPEYTCSDYAIWSRPLQSLRFNNVGTAASITGGARAKLMLAKHYAKNPIYCDTDSLICEELNGVEISDVKLGAWKVEAEMSTVRIAGKKLYGYFDGTKHVIKAKGAAGVSWGDLDDMIHGKTIIAQAFAPTLTKQGKQAYIDRKLAMTTPIRNV